MAPEIDKAGVPGLAADELDEAEARTVAALEQFGPTGDILELACGA